MQKGEIMTTERFKVIALTGGPCGGKSTSLERLKKDLKENGYEVYTVPETCLLLHGCGSVFPGFDEEKRTELFEYEANLLQLLINLERAIFNAAKFSGKRAVVICDRGAVDIKAYLPEDGELWNQLLLKVGTTEKELIDRYDLVIHLTTAAKGAETFYTTENNVSRRETIEEARALDTKTLRVWKDHPRLLVALNTEGGFEAKLNFLSQEVLSYLQSNV